MKFNCLIIKYLDQRQIFFRFFRVTIFKIGYQCKIKQNFKLIKMKKVFSIIAVAFVAASFVACGPSAEEKAKMEENAKRTADSIANAISASMNEAAVEPAADSTAAATATTAPAEEAHH